MSKVRGRFVGAMYPEYPAMDLLTGSLSSMEGEQKKMYDEIKNVTINDQAIDLTKTYSMLVSNYRYNDRADYPVYADVTLINESVMTKFGFKVGEVLLVIKKL